MGGIYTVPKTIGTDPADDQGTEKWGGATVSKNEALRQLKKIKRAKSSLLDFIEFSNPNYKAEWFHKLVCKKIDELLEKKYEMLIVSMPPRHGKTEIVSRRLPAYVLGKDPASWVMSCSYAADLASRLNRDVQRIISTPKYRQVFPRTTLAATCATAHPTKSRYVQNATTFEVVGHGGGYRCAGVGGGITGMGFDGVGIVDDPVKNREEAESPSIRKKQWEWYTDVFLTRRENNAPIVVTSTRWHEDDLVGRIIEKKENEDGTDSIKIIRLPALYEEGLSGEYDSRGPGDALWPEKYPAEYLKKMKQTMPTYSWLALYQQSPTAVEGNLVKRDDIRECVVDLYSNTVTLYPSWGAGEAKTFILDHCRIFQTCDPAASIKNSADFFALGTWLQTPDNDLCLVDLIHTRMETPDQITTLTAAHKKWSSFVGGLVQYIGTRGLGIGLFQLAKHAGLPIREVVEDTDKLTRFLPAAGRICAGSFYISSTLPHKNDYIAEILTFPNAPHDDLVDITSIAFANAITRPFSANVAHYPTNNENKKPFVSRNLLPKKYTGNTDNILSVVPQSPHTTAKKTQLQLNRGRMRLF